MPIHVLLTRRYRFHRAISYQELARTDTGEDLCSCQVFRRKAGQAETESCDGSPWDLRSGADGDVRGPRNPRFPAILGQPKLPDAGGVGFLAREIDTVFHNGATVNYLYNYDLMA